MDVENNLMCQSKGRSSKKTLLLSSGRREISAEEEEANSGLEDFASETQVNNWMLPGVEDDRHVDGRDEDNIDGITVQETAQASLLTDTRPAVLPQVYFFQFNLGSTPTPWVMIRLLFPHQQLLMF